jgi:hypothetical protein
VGNAYVSDGIHGWDLDAMPPWTPGQVDALKISKVDALTTLGGAARIWRSDWIVYTPPASFMTDQVDAFSYWVTDGNVTGQ